MRYAGIGPRSTPAPVFQAMRDLARVLAFRGFTLRSGGADTAFELGAVEAFGEMEVYLPWAGFNGRAYPAVPLSKGSFDLAQTFHHDWSALSQAAQKRHACTMYQLLGASLREPVEFVICWTEEDFTSGPHVGHDPESPASAIVLAGRRGIPVYNLANPHAAEKLRLHLDGEPCSKEAQLALF